MQPASRLAWRAAGAHFLATESSRLSQRGDHDSGMPTWSSKRHKVANSLNYWIVLRLIFEHFSTFCQFSVSLTFKKTKLWVWKNLAKRWKQKRSAGGWRKKESRRARAEMYACEKPIQSLLGMFCMHFFGPLLFSRRYCKNALIRRRFYFLVLGWDTRSGKMKTYEILG